MNEWIRRVLSRPGIDKWIIVIGTLLLVPSIPTGLAGDDYIHELVLSGSKAIPALSRAPLDLFHFASPAFMKRLMDQGIFPWYADPNVRFAFFRPLGAVTHWIDHLLAPDSAAFKHVHSVAWSALGLWGVRALYRSVLGAGWVASLALAFYAFDDVRAPAMAWVANRSEVVGFAISVWTIVWYVESRRGEAGKRWASLAALAVSLFASEGAISVTAYLFAYDLFLETDALESRIGRLAPFAAVVLVWSGVYHGLGYGIAGSGVYFDPVSDTGSYLRAFPGRSAALWLSQLGGPWAEAWNAYAVLLPGVESAVAVLAIVSIVGWAWLYSPLWRSDARMRFFLLGALVSTLPACTTFTSDRMLPWIGLGATAACALFFAGVAERTLAGGRLRQRISLFATAAIVGLHLIAGPVLLAVRSYGLTGAREAIERADRGVPSTPDVENRVVIYVNTPSDAFATYIPVTRAALGRPRARSQHWLTSGPGPVRVERVDERTLRVTPEQAFMGLTSELLFRNPSTHPFAVGDQIDVGEMRVEVLAVAPDGRPRSILARFARPLEDPTYVWLSWQVAGYGPFVPPAVGLSVTVPGPDYVLVAYGPGTVMAHAFGR
jgi:hypothetical protein